MMDFAIHLSESRENLQLIEDRIYVECFLNLASVRKDVIWYDAEQKIVQLDMEIYPLGILPIREKITSYINV